MNYPVLCGSCSAPAVFKVAAGWTDGVTSELKTYALTCADCLADQYAMAKLKQGQYRLLPGETLAVPGIYAMCRGTRDRRLVRQPELET